MGNEYIGKLGERRHFEFFFSRTLLANQRLLICPSTFVKNFLVFKVQSESIHIFKVPVKHNMNVLESFTVNFNFNSCYNAMF